MLPAPCATWEPSRTVTTAASLPSLEDRLALRRDEGATQGPKTPSPRNRGDSGQPSERDAFADFDDLVDDALAAAVAERLSQDHAAELADQALLSLLFDSDYSVKSRRS
jgi:hypothetical protein